MSEQATALPLVTTKSRRFMGVFASGRNHPTTGRILRGIVHHSNFDVLTQPGSTTDQKAPDLNQLRSVSCPTDFCRGLSTLLHRLSPAPSWGRPARRSSSACAFAVSDAAPCFL